MAEFKSGLRGALKHIDTVVLTMKKTEFRFTRNMDFDRALNYLTNLLSLDETTTIVFCFLFYMFYDNNEYPITPSQLANFTGCSPMMHLQFTDEIQTLKAQGLIETAAKPHERAACGDYFKIPSSVERFIQSEGRESRLESMERDLDSKLIFPSKIKEKELFYNKEITDQVEKFSSALQEKNLGDIQRRLEEYKMPLGISAIFFGEPGTGKTETVYQLARKTKRPIFHVNIGEVISEWHNATEKKLGELFDQYKKIVEHSNTRREPVPIFLFNEADVIFGKRLNPPRQGSEISENRVQNILLERMEKMEGILIATTNMESNLDEAFSRRFLFKIKFPKPDAKVQEKIWQYKLSWLNQETARKLSSSYEFSGGEIDNIAKKAIMEEIIGGKRATVSDLEDYCKVEKLSRENPGRRVGFGGMVSLY